MGTYSGDASPSDVESPMYSTERHDVCVGAAGFFTGVVDAALTAEEVEEVEEVDFPPEPEPEDWLELLPPHALSSAAETTASTIRRTTTIRLVAVAIITRAGCRLRTRRR